MNLIITAATGYQAKQLFPFLDSVQKHCINAKVVIISHKKDTQTRSILKGKYSFITFTNIPSRSKLSVKLFRVINNHLGVRNYFSKSQFLRLLQYHFLHIALRRYFIALDIVRDHKDSVTNVLLSDSRDVLFQADPFALIKDEVVSGLESERMTIGKCATNSNWIKQAYGEEGLSQINNCRIICSGVSLGPVSKIEEYLIEFCREMDAKLAKIASSDSIDQGIHNYLANTGRIRITAVDNREGFIATLGYENPSVLEKDKATGMIRVHERFPAIVHQYDRHPSLALP